MTARSARFEFRVDPQSKTAIEQAASIAGENASDFARRAAVERAQAVLREQRVTVVPPEYFDTLMAELDAPPHGNERVRAAARRLGDQVEELLPGINSPRNDPGAGDFVGYLPESATSPDHGLPFEGEDETDGTGGMVY
jgi:uncharacterized protein (DUF1778 family)